MMRLLSYVFPQIVWIRKSDRPQVFLTFDDGPHTLHTGQILDILKYYQVKATFFLVGKNAVQHPDLIHRMYAEGHVLGNHSFSHRNMIFMSADRMRDEILRTQRMLTAITGNAPQYFRPPYGYFSPGLIRTCQQLGLTMVLWTIMTYDFRTTVVDQQIMDNIDRHKTNGAILVLHDGHENSARTVKMLPPLIDLFLKNNYILASL